ncbi:hypothetical protein KEM54_002254 [Ascosphaera aggregata]|nr:hypothetical protein KEM54_002254 [Ascosphaera aggregata]
MLASISRQQPQPQAQAPTLDSSTGVNPASLPITNRRDNRKASEISFCNYCFFSDCNSAVAKYQHDNGYPPVPMRHPGHRHVAAVKSAMSSSYRCIQESTATSASVLNVTTPPTPRKPNSGQSRNRGPSTADNTNRDPDSACSGHRHSCTGTAASAEIVTGLVTTAAKPAICKQHKGWLDSWQLIHEVNHVDDSGDNAEKQISPTHPCRHSQGPTELHLPSHKASRFPRSCSACRPGTSVAVIQQHKKHEWQNYCPDVFKADVECQLGVISLPNSDADAESSRVFELPNVASQQDSHREFNREDKAPSRYNHGYGHPYDLYGDYSQKHVERSRFVPSTGRRETAKHGDSIPNPSIPQVNKIRSQTSVFGNIKNCREKNESVASGSGAADTMITTAFGSDRNQFPRTSNQSIRLSHYSRDICDCTVAEAAYVHFSGSIYSQAYREDSHDNTRGNIRQSMEDVRYKSFKSHPTQMSISKGPFPPRAASCSSVSTTNHSNSRFINVQIATDNRLQRNHGSGEKSSQPHVKNPANTQLYDQEFSPIVSSDEKPSHSQHSSPFKAPVSRCCSNGRKLKKSVSLSPLLLGKGLSEMARGKRIEGKTGSPQSLPYRFKAAQERWQSADCSGLSPWLTAQKRMKDLHRKASVSHLKINLLGETMGEVSFPIYSGSASSTSSHLYYSCNEEAMPNESAETAQSYGKDGGNCILTPLSRHSPFIPEYESSSDPSTSDEEELEIHDVKIESAQRVRHRRVDAVEIKEIDIKPRQGPHPPPKPSQTSGSPVFKLLPDNIPRRRLKRRNIEALNRFPPRRTASEPSHSPTSVSEKERLSHSASFTTISKRPALRRAEPYVRQCHSLPASNLISPTFNCMTEDEIATLRDRMQSSSSTSSGQSSWSQNSNASENSLRTFVDLKDASFVFN